MLLCRGCRPDPAAQQQPGQARPARRARGSSRHRRAGRRPRVHLSAGIRRHPRRRSGTATAHTTSTWGAPVRVTQRLRPRTMTAGLAAPSSGSCTPAAGPRQAAAARSAGIPHCTASPGRHYGFSARCATASLATVGELARLMARPARPGFQPRRHRPEERELGGAVPCSEDKRRQPRHLHRCSAGAPRDRVMPSHRRARATSAQLRLSPEQAPARRDCRHDRRCHRDIPARGSKAKDQDRGSLAGTAAVTRTTSRRSARTRRAPAAPASEERSRAPLAT